MYVYIYINAYIHIIYTGNSLLKNLLFIHITHAHARATTRATNMCMRMREKGKECVLQRTNSVEDPRSPLPWGLLLDHPHIGVEACFSCVKKTKEKHNNNNNAL